MILSGVDSQFTVTIVSRPAGTPVSGSTNTFEYPILSSVTLTCNVASNDGSSFTVTAYHWKTAGCYTNSKFTGSNPQCFPRGKTTQSVTGNDLNAEDAGTISCSARISNSDYASEPFTLRISGEWLVYYMIVLYGIILASCMPYVYHIIILHTSCYDLCIYCRCCTNTW